MLIDLSPGRTLAGPENEQGEKINKALSDELFIRKSFINFTQNGG